jgi:hypothetical protein
VLWRWVVVLLAAALGAAYAVHPDRAFPHGGSPLGLTLGVATLGLVLLLAFYGVRKRLYRVRWGHLEGWLQAHFYLGLLSIAVALFHSGFRFQDRVAVAALVLLALVVATGILGAVLYATVPRVLTEIQSNVPLPDLSRDLNRQLAAMDRLAEGKSATFQRVLSTLREEARPRPLAGWRLLLGRPPRLGDPGGLDPLELRRVPVEEQEDLKRLLVLSRQQKEQHQRLVLQQRYQNLLEVWLYLHLPLSLALLVAIAFHVGAVLYFRGVPGGP